MNARAVKQIIVKFGFVWVVFFAAPDPRHLFDAAFDLPSVESSLFANSPWQACRRLILHTPPSGRQGHVFIDNSPVYDVKIGLTAKQSDRLLMTCRQLTADNLGIKRVTQKKEKEN